MLGLRLVGGGLLLAFVLLNCGGATTAELDRLSIQTAAALIVEEPQYAKLAGHLLATYIDKEVRNQGIYAFSQSVQMGHQVGLVNDRNEFFLSHDGGVSWAP